MARELESRSHSSRSSSHHSSSSHKSSSSSSSRHHSSSHSSSSSRRHDKYDSKDRDDEHDMKKRKRDEEEKSKSATIAPTIKADETVGSTNGSNGESSKKFKSDHPQEDGKTQAAPAAATPTPTSGEGATASPEDAKKAAEEAKKARLQAWKAQKEKLLQEQKQKQLEEEERKRKELEEQKKKDEQQQQQQQQQKGRTLLSFSSLQRKPEIKKPAFKFEEETKETATEKTLDDDVDPLDAFMQDIEKQAHKQLGGSIAPLRAQSISLDEIIKGTSKEEKQEEEKPEEEEDEEYHKLFLESIKSAETAKAPEAAAETKEKKEELLFSDDDDDNTDGHFFEDPEAKKKANKKDLKPVDHSKMNYPPFRRDFYIEPKELSKYTPEEIEEYRKLNGIKVRGKNVPTPIRGWHQCGLSDIILDVIKESNYSAPFPIQAQAIPAIMSGRDVIGIAKTGSGKTLAFLLPMLRHILDQPPLVEGDGPIGLVIAPTRELAVQIHNEAKKFTKPLGLRVVCAYGGAGVADQIAQLKRGAEIVVCTPGRMIDLLCANGGRVTNLTRVTYVVLDEADRMFDMGFGPQIHRIVGNVRPDRQTVMFSATFPKQVEALAKKVLVKPVEIIVGGRSVACDTVTQYVEVRTEESKFLRLLELLGTWQDKGNIIIFVDRQQECDNLFRDLMAAGYQALALHGGMDQLDRDYTLQQFKKKEKTILVSTSVAARGLDVQDLNLVINYNCPNHYEDYVHRVGRTGRAGKRGTAYTFIQPDEERFAGDLVRALEASKHEVPPELKKMADDFWEKKKSGLVQSYSGSGYGGKGFKFDEAEEAKKKAERKQQAKNLGLETEEDEEEDEGKIVDTDEADATEGGAKKPTPAITIGGPAGVKGPEGGAPANPMMSLAKAQAFAAALNITSTLARINPALAAATVSGPTHFQEEVEINNYPQQARWQVTNKETIEWLSEATGAAITTKGLYYPPGKNPPPGERKLYLLIEGPNEDSVKHAKREIMKMLEEATERAASTTSRYKVI